MYQAKGAYQGGVEDSLVVDIVTTEDYERHTVINPIADAIRVDNKQQAVLVIELPCDAIMHTAKPPTRLSPLDSL
jgi:hypothetical protein